MYSLSKNTYFLWIYPLLHIDFFSYKHLWENYTNKQSFYGKVRFICLVTFWSKVRTGRGKLKFVVTVLPVFIV